MSERRVTIDTFATVDLTLSVHMSAYGSEWDMEKMFEQVIREAEQKVRSMFDPSRVSGYSIKKIKATAVLVEKQT